MKTPTTASLEQAIKKKGYKWFDNDEKNYNLNIIGIRSSVRRANKFDDQLIIAWKFEGLWTTHSAPITTDPGSYYLQNLLNPKGCAILVPGQYVGVYALGLHRGKYETLCQRLGSVKVYRDKDRDNILDMDPATITEGSFGINIHHDSGSPEDMVGRDSAGCQVYANLNDWSAARELWRKSRAQFSNKFTYTLLEEEDFA